MATTGAPANIPLLDDNSPVTPIQAPFNAMATALNTYLKSKDTGWVTINPPSGLTGTDFAYRVLGGVTYLRGSVKLNSGNFPSGYTVVGTLPAGTRPSAYMRAAVGVFNGFSANVVIATDGNIAVGASADRSADTVYFGAVSFPADR